MSRDAGTSYSINSSNSSVTDQDWSIALRNLVGSIAWDAWFKSAVCAGTDHNRCLLLPNRFIADWVNNHYGHCLRQLKVRVAIVAPRTASTNAIRPERAVTASKIATDPRGQFDPEMSLDRFVLSASNRVAFEVVKRLDCESSVPPYTPLYINGIAGVGKTHLMYGLAQRMIERGKRPVYFSSDQFLNKFVRAVRERDVESLSDELLSADAVMLDDFQFLIGKERTQEYFFKIFNSLIEARKLMIISSDQLPSEFVDIHERMRSRLGSGMVVTIDQPDYELRAALLRAWDPTIKDDVLGALAQLSISVRELRGALTRINIQASCIGRPVTLELAQNILSDLIKIRRPTPSMDDIMHEVLVFAQRHGLKISKDRLRIAGRTAMISEMRQVFMFLAHEIGSVTPACIGRYLNNRDRTTIRHGIMKIRKRMTEERYIVDMMDEIRRGLGA
jgi:chromosomal replication initiator protein